MEIYKTHDNIRSQRKPSTPEDIINARVTIEDYQQQIKVKIPRVKRGPRAEQNYEDEEEVPTDQTSDLFELDMYLDKILEE
jgi:hypothetical protein